MGFVMGKAPGRTEKVSVLLPQASVRVDSRSSCCLEGQSPVLRNCSNLPSGQSLILSWPQLPHSVVCWGGQGQNQGIGVLRQKHSGSRPVGNSPMGWTGEGQSEKGTGGVQTGEYRWPKHLFKQEKTAGLNTQTHTHTERQRERAPGRQRSSVTFDPLFSHSEVQ